MSSKETKSKKQSSKDNSSNKKKVRRASAKVDKNKLLIEKITIENKDFRINFYDQRPNLKIFVNEKKKKSLIC